MTQPENPHPYHSAAWFVVEERRLRARLHQVELERDIAERERAVLRADLEEERRVGSLAMQSTIVAERERDEARAQLDRARLAVERAEAEVARLSAPPAAVEYCASCGRPSNDHPFRHPFKPPFRKEGTRG